MQTATTTYDTCVACDGPLDVLTRPASRKRFFERLGRSLVPPIGWTTAAVILGAGVLVGAIHGLEGHLGSAGLAAATLALVAPPFWTVFFALVRSATLADLSPEATPPMNALDELAMPALRACLLTGGSWAVQFSPVPLKWGFEVIALVALPAVLVHLARGDGLLEVVNARRWLETTRTLGANGVAAGLMLAFLAGVSVASVGAAAYDAREGLPPFAFFMRMIAVLGLLLGARVVGLLMSAHAVELGVGAAVEQVPVLGDVAPRGRRAPRPVEAPKPRGPIDLEP